MKTDDGKKASAFEAGGIDVEALCLGLNSIEPSDVATREQWLAIRSAITALRRDSADARRYQWIQSSNCYWVELQAQPDGQSIYKGEGGCELDDAIDRRIAALGEGVEGGGK